MALKADRQIDAVEIRYFLNEIADKGVVVTVSTGGSGVAMEDNANLLTVSAGSSGAKPVGILLNEFVNVDQTRTPINWHKDQSQVGSKASVLTKGWVVTDKITGTPGAGDIAVLSSSGTVTNIAPSDVLTWNKVANPEIGRFRTAKDQNGYASVYVDL